MGKVKASLLNMGMTVGPKPGRANGKGFWEILHVLTLIRTLMPLWSLGREVFICHSPFVFYREQSPKLCCRRVSRGVSPSLSISPHLSPQHTHWPSRQLSVSSHKSGENAGFQRGSLVAINLCVSAVNGEFQELYNKIVLAFLMYKAIVICVSHSTIYGPSGWGGGVSHTHCC